MKQFMISVDSTCDLYRDYIVENDLKFVPLTFTVEKNGTLEDRLDAFTEYSQYVDLYNELRAGALSKTSKLNYESHREHFEKLAKEGAKDVLHFTISSGLANTHELAEAAAEEVKKEYPDFNVLVVDPLTTTVGCAALVRIALKDRDDGKSVQEAFDHVIGLRLHIQHFIVADDLQYLKRGGRLSAAAAAVGGLLHIKPIISFDKEGKLTTIAKPKGVKKAISFIKEKMMKEGPDENKYVFIVHTDNEPVANELATFVREQFGIEPFVSIMGPTVGSHVGPNAFALGYITKSERNEF